jgi:hypothetical protein
MPKPSHTIVGSKRERFAVILVGAVVGYVVGHIVEDRFAVQDARIAGAMIGGILAGIIGRFALARFRDSPQTGRSR